MASRTQFQKLILPNVADETVIEFVVEFGSTSEQILQACQTRKANLLILGLNRSEHIETRSHLPWSMAQKIMCGASCPVLTMKAAARHSAKS